MYNQKEETNQFTVWMTTEEERLYKYLIGLVDNHCLIGQKRNQLFVSKLLDHYISNMFQLKPEDNDKDT